jgi:hypothetical protein
MIELLTPQQPGVALANYILTLWSGGIGGDADIELINFALPFGENAIELFAKESSGRGCDGH